MVFLPHTNTVILVEPYCGTITEPGSPVVEREKRRGLKARASTKRAPAFSFLAFRSRSRAPCSPLSLSLQSSVDAGWKSTRSCNLGYFSYKAHLVTGYSAVKLNAYKRLNLINNKVDNKDVCQKSHR